jgi:hypothetical protein
MNAPDDVSYRLALAKGFLAEAEQDMTLKHWRSCVDNSQLTVENAGKTVGLRRYQLNTGQGTGGGEITPPLGARGSRAATLQRLRSPRPSCYTV